MYQQVYGGNKNEYTAIKNDFYLTKEFELRTVGIDEELISVVKQLNELDIFVREVDKFKAIVKGQHYSGSTLSQDFSNLKFAIRGENPYGNLKNVLKVHNRALVIQYLSSLINGNATITEQSESAYLFNELGLDENCFCHTNEHCFCGCQCTTIKHKSGPIIHTVLGDSTLKEEYDNESEYVENPVLEHILIQLPLVNTPKEELK